MTIAAIHQPQYLPYLGFFHKVAHADVLVVMDDVVYQRRGVQNRNRIKSPTGARWVTVPVLHNDGQRINEVATNPTERWSDQHLNALRHNYARAPYFDVLFPQIEATLSVGWDRLFDLNMATMKWILSQLGITTELVLSSSLGATGHKSELLAGLCKAAGADTYLSGPGGRRYMEMEVFDRMGVDVLWQDFESPQYEQLFPQVGFIPDLSIIDALMCCGPTTASLIR